MTEVFSHSALARRTLLLLGSTAAAIPLLPHPALAIPRAGAGLGFLQTRMPFWGAAGVNPGGQTLTSAYTSESPYLGVQLFYLNSDTTAHSIDSASIAPTVQLGDATNPCNTSGAADATLWQPVTFGGKRSGVVPAGVHGNTGIFPTLDTVHGLLVSDVMPISSLPRTDGAYPLLLTRTFTAGPMPVSVSGDVLAQSPVGGGAFDAASNGRIVRAGMIAGDAASAPGIAQGTPGQALAPAGVIFHTATASLAVMVGGDSIFQGYGTQTHQNDAFHIAACQMSTPALPVTVCKLAYAGMPTASFMANLQQMVIAAPPNLVFIKPASSNDKLSGTPQGISQTEGMLIDLVDWIAGRGIMPAVCTDIPYGQNSYNDPLRLQMNANLRRWGWYCADCDPTVSNGASPAAIQPQFSSFTLAPHPNDAGDAAMAVPIAAIMRKYLAT